MTAYVQNFTLLPFAGGLSLCASGPVSPSAAANAGGGFHAGDPAWIPAIHCATKWPGFGGLWRGLGNFLGRLGTRTAPLATTPPEEPGKTHEPELIFTRVNITHEGGKTIVEVPCVPAGFNSFEHMSAITRDLVHLRAAKPGDIEFKFYEGIERDVLIWAKWELRKQRPAVGEILKFARAVDAGGKLNAEEKARLKECASSIEAFQKTMSDSLTAWTWAGSGGTMRSHGQNASSLVDLVADYLGNVASNLVSPSAAASCLLAGRRVDARLLEVIRVYLLPSVGDSLRASIALSADSLLQAGMDHNSVTVDRMQEAKHILLARGEEVEMPIIDSVAQILQLIARTGDIEGATGEPLIRIEFGPVIHRSLPVKIRGEGFVVAERAPRRRFDDHLTMSSINDFLASLQLPVWSWTLIEGKSPEFTIGLPATELIWPENAEFVFGEE